VLRLAVQSVKLTQEYVSFRCVSFCFASQVRVSLPHLESILDYDENENDCNSTLASDNCTTGRANTARAVIVMYAKSSQLAVFVCSLCSPHFHCLIWSFTLLCTHSVPTLHFTLATYRHCIGSLYYFITIYVPVHSLVLVTCSVLFTFLTAHSSLHTCLSQVQQWFAFPNLSR
jgi:hypothetical protein